MSAAERARLIEQYRDGVTAVTAALTDITDAELDAHPADGSWSVREIVHHLADSEMTSAIRLRRLIAEERAVITGYDPEEFARRLFYRRRPIAGALMALTVARTTTAEILDYLTDADWARVGWHTESGVYTVTDWLTIYAAHAHDHAAQIRQARAAVAVAVPE